MTDTLGNSTEYAFDKNGRVGAIKDPMEHVTSLAYDSGGRVASRLDTNGKLTRYEYDALGRAVRQIDANEGEVSFTYDGRGNLASLTDPNGNTTSFEYDLADRKTRETNPLNHSTEYTYYPNGLLHTVRDAKGQTATYAYDAAGRLTNITYADGRQDAFTYDAVGNMLAYSNEGVSATLVYDALNRKTSETISYGTFTKTYSYTYDSRGNKASYTSPEGAVYSYAYSLTNQPTGISFNGSAIAFEYLANRLVKTTFPNGITTDYQYNENSWLTYITTKEGAATLSSYVYDFDNAGNITSKATEHGGYNYNYDNIYQLTESTAPAPSLQELFTYDPSGNRTLDNSTPTGLTFGTTEFYYNSRNRLETVTLPDGRTATYTYDPFGRRIKKTILPPPPVGGGMGEGETTYYAYSDEGLIGEYDAAGNPTKAYGWRPDTTWGTAPVLMVENGNYYFYHNDHLGTPQWVSDTNGAAVWSAKYTAFGNAEIQIATITNNLRFPGQYYDEETGLHYNWNRYYDPRTGRYTQEDPIGFGGGINFYLYVNNNSLNYRDQFGLIPLPPIFTDAFPNSDIIAPMADIIVGGIEAGVAVSFGVAAVITFVAGPEFWPATAVFAHISIEFGVDAVDRITSGIDKLNDHRKKNLNKKNTNMDKLCQL